MDNLVTTLETSKRLKAAGFPNHAAFCWNNTNPAELVPYHLGERHNGENSCPAPTAQEIADQLEDSLTIFKGRTATESGKYWAQYTSGYDDYAEANETSGKWGSTMAEALALLWLKLKENA